jgi:translation initiation factor 2B subunit (eIF-2B alpha/beta/delta family)
MKDKSLVKSQEAELREAKGELPASQLSQTKALMEEITAVIVMVKGAKKLGVEKRASILSKLVKSHAELVKTQRTMLGLDNVTGNINAGVIIIPGKSSNWAEDAQVEIENAKVMIGKAQEVQDTPDPEQS